MWNHQVVALLVCCSVAQTTAQFMFDEYPPLFGKMVTKESIFTTKKVLSEGMEMPAKVTTGNLSTYVFLHGMGPLTFIIRPCNSSINVTIFHILSNKQGFLTDYIQERSNPPLVRSRGKQMHVFSWPQAPTGLYMFDLIAEDRDTMITMYATNSPTVPPALRFTQKPKVRIEPRLHKNTVTIRWERSIIDRLDTEYCVTVNSRHNFSCLCEANTAMDMNVYKSFQESYKNTSRSDKRHRDVGRNFRKNDVFITCVGTKLSYTLNYLQKGREYYFNIFAKNGNTSISFLHANTYLKFEFRARPVGLRDNKPVTANIRKLGGKVLFRYKVNKIYSSRNLSTLSWHIMPCGGTVQVQMSMQQQVVIPQQTVEGYHVLRITNPKPGMRYVLHVYVADPKQMMQIRGIEVLATMKTSPLPQLPVQAVVHEWVSLRTCDSVTVGWVPVTAQTVKYCVSASLLPSKDAEYYFRSRPNQCNLDNRLRTQLDFATRQCQEFSANDNRNMLTATVTKLLPGRKYLIQVTVKKIKGKALSYDLITAQTKTSC